MFSLAGVRVSTLRGLRTCLTVEDPARTHPLHARLRPAQIEISLQNLASSLLAIPLYSLVLAPFTEILERSGGVQRLEFLKLDFGCRPHFLSTLGLSHNSHMTGEK